MANEDPALDEMSAVLLNMLRNLIQFMNWKEGAGIGSVENGFDAGKVSSLFVDKGHQRECNFVIRKHTLNGDPVDMTLPVTIQIAGPPGLGYKAYQIRLAVIESQNTVSPAVPTGGPYPVDRFYRDASARLIELFNRQP